MTRATEAWREALGALRFTLWDDNAPEWQIERARNEVEWLCRILNAYTDGAEGPVPMKGMGVEK